jgi:hypothetical protein
MALVTDVSHSIRRFSRHEENRLVSGPLHSVRAKNFGGLVEDPSSGSRHHRRDPSSLLPLIGTPHLLVFGDAL